jgi:hydrogenase maturation protease
VKPGPTTETALLVVGYGNTLRSDDGAGVLVAERVDALGIAGVRVIACPQLTPELAADLAGAGTVVFVDAAAKAGREVVLQPLAADEGCPVSTHATDPRALLALAEILYGHAPVAWLLEVPAENFDHGECLSAVTQRGVETAAEKIRALAVA